MIAGNGGWGARLLPLLMLFSIIATPEAACSEQSPTIFEVSLASRETGIEETVFSPDGRYVLSGGGGFVRVWDLLTGRSGRVFGDGESSSFHYGNTLFSPNGKYAFWAAPKGKLWDIATGRLIRSNKPNYYAKAFAFSPDSVTILYAGEDKSSGAYTCWLWNVSTGKQVKFDTIEGHLDRINDAAFSPDGRYVITGSNDFTLKLWDVASGKMMRTLEGHTSPVEKVAFSPDSQYVLSTERRPPAKHETRIWEVGFGVESRTLPFDLFNKVSFSSDGRYILTGTRIYDFLTGEIVLSVPAQKANMATFSPDGHVILTKSHGKLELWDMWALKVYWYLMQLDMGPDCYYHTKKIRERWKQDALLASMISYEDGEWIIMTPEGYFNASQNGGNHLKVRVGRNVYSINNFYDRFYNPAVVSQKLRGKISAADHDIREGVATPPKIMIANPKSGETYDDSSVQVVVRAMDTGGGIDEIRLFHNDCGVGDKGRGLAVTPRENVVEKTYGITLLPGDNFLKVIGFSRDRTESNPYEITVKHIGEKKEIGLYLVVIGINDYKNPAMQLNYATADATGIKNLFEKKWSHLFDQFHLIEIYDQNATKFNIEKKLSQLNAQEQDAVIIYIAGHGLISKDQTRDEWYFVSYDVVRPEREEDLKKLGISGTEMIEMVRDIRALKKILLIDACNSGGVLNALSRGVEDRRAISQLARSTGTHVIASTTDKQFATELAQIGHGVFTYALLKGLGGEAGNRDKTVTVRELIAYVEEVLPDISQKYKAQPQYPVIESRGQDFPVMINK